MAYCPIHEDPNVPEGSVEMMRVTVDQYITPDGQIAVRTFYDGDGNLSQCLGLLVLGAIDIYGRCDR